MKTNQKLLIVYFVIFIIILPSCVPTVHETTSNQPKTSLNESIDIMKEAIKDSTNSVALQIAAKAVRDIDVSGDGITLVNFDNTKRYYTFNGMVDPVVYDDILVQNYVVKFGHSQLDRIIFKNSKSAIMFADALYNLKHTYNKQPREREQADSIRRAQQTAIEEQKARDKKQEESLRLIRKTGVQEETGAARDEGITESATPRRKSQPRPAPPKKAAVEPSSRQPEIVAPPPPALPAGGAVSGN